MTLKILHVHKIKKAKEQRTSKKAPEVSNFSSAQRKRIARMNLIYGNVSDKVHQITM